MTRLQTHQLLRTLVMLAIIVLAAFVGEAMGADSLWQAASQERPTPSTAYEIEQAKISDASAKDAVWLGITGSMDIYSTSIGLHRCPTCFEGNPILPNSEARIAVKAGYTVAAWYGLRKLRNDAHPRLANILRWCVVGLNLAFTANNTVHAIRGH